MEFRIGLKDGLTSRVHHFNGSVSYAQHWSELSSVVIWVGRRDRLSSRVGHKSGYRVGLFVGVSFSLVAVVESVDILNVL